eukprot:53994-Eustigmatos_ZCMA.PRE.1
MVLPEAFRLACMGNGRYQDVTHFLAKNSELYHEQDEDGNTALDLAVHFQEREVVLYLLNYDGIRVSINRLSPLGFSPLHLACQKGWCDVVIAMLKLGADVDMPD